MACIACGRGLHSECQDNPCCCSDESLWGSGEFSERDSTNKHISLRENVGVSAGRKRAAARYEIISEKPCEWRWKSNCGGGRFPILGCLSGNQQHRHHGPIKDTTRNEPENVHRICAVCIAPWTPILMYDLTWKPAELIVEGDLLFGFTENIKGNGYNIKFEKSTVESVRKVYEPSFKFKMSNNKVLISSRYHQWVSSSPGRHHLGWRTSQQLKVGYNLRYLVDPWDVDYSWESGWLAGILDGEGTINSTQLGVSQKEDGLIIDAIQNELESRIKGNIHHTNRPAKNNWQESWVFRITNLPDILTLLGTVRPHRLLDQFYTKYNILNKNPLIAQKNNKVSIKTIEDIGKTEVVSIQTSSKTFFANGFLSHNCHNNWHAKNDPIYNEEEFEKFPHNPMPMTTEQMIERGKS